MNTQSKRQIGFTMIELLVVVSIIGILTTLITSNLATAQSRARDARRKTDLKVIAQGLEMYYSQNNSYPAVGNGSTGTFDFATGSLIDSNGADVYIKTMPKDPRNVAGATSSTYFEYYYCTSAAGATPRRVYNLYANLENNADPDRLCGSGSTATDFTTAGGAATCDADAASTCSEGSSVTTAGTATNTLGNVRTRNDFTVSDP
jgi:general secretion pathway protein G